MSYARVWDGFQWPKKDENGQTHQPVLRNSRRTLGPDEPSRRISERQRQAWLRAYDRAAKQARPAKVRRGAAGTYSWFARQVLDYLMGFAVATGRIYPSIEQIAEVIGGCTSQVVRALRQLKEGGWISWDRRIKPADTAPGEPGPQIAQDSNFYRVHLPIPAAELLKGWREAQGRKRGLSPEERERRARASAVAAERRDLNRKAGVLAGFLAAARKADRRRIEGQLAQVRAAAAEAERREAEILAGASAQERDTREGRE